MTNPIWYDAAGREHRRESCLKPMFGEGQPVLSRRTSLLIAVGSVLFSLLVGSALGIAASTFQNQWWAR